jgi:hypothetical protein
MHVFINLPVSVAFVKLFDISKSPERVKKNKQDGINIAHDVTFHHENKT